MEESKASAWRHRVLLIDREELEIDGVDSLGSCDEKEISMESGMGKLRISGQGLNVKQLNLAAGKISVEGQIKGIVYEDLQTKRRGLLNRFLK